MKTEVVQHMKLIATDLDGTLLASDKSISTVDFKTLLKLGEQGIARVAATGRSLFKVKEVLPENTPIDYVVFSSGAGIYDWKNENLLHSEFFDEATAQKIIIHLLQGNYNFFVYNPIPNNNLFRFHHGADWCPEFENYLERHNGDFAQLDSKNLAGLAGQIMAVIPNNTNLFEALKAEIEAACSGIRVIRTTSPVDDGYIWLEIFPENVSKGHGIKWLCDYLKVNYADTVGIGNDYNDLDMFEFVAQPYVLSNGVDVLKEQFNTVKSTNNESGFTAVICELSEMKRF